MTTFVKTLYVFTEKNRTKCWFLNYAAFIAFKVARSFIINKFHKTIF